MDTNENREQVQATGDAVVVETKKTSAPLKRRQYDEGYKRRVVEETLTGQDSVSVVARRHDLNANMVFRWRREFRQGQVGDSLPALVPVSVHGGNHVGPLSAQASKPVDSGRLQVALSNGHQVVIEGQVDGDQLQWVLHTLSTC